MIDCRSCSAGVAIVWDSELILDFVFEALCFLHPRSLVLGGA